MKMLDVVEEGSGRSYCRRRRAVTVDLPDPESERTISRTSQHRRE